MLEALERGNLFLVHSTTSASGIAITTSSQRFCKLTWWSATWQVAALHLLASAWNEQNGFLPDAIATPLPPRILSTQPSDRTGRAGNRGWKYPAGYMAWLGKTLPEELIQVRPVLSVWYAYLLLGGGELESAESRFKDAERWLKPADTMKANQAAPSAEPSPIIIEGWLL